MKVILNDGVTFDTREAMDQLLPFLEDATVTGKQLVNAMEAQEVGTGEWIMNLYFKHHRPLAKIYARHPKHTWIYFKQNKITYLKEVILYKAALAALYKDWYSNRPDEVKGKKAKREPGSRAVKGKGRKLAETGSGTVCSSEQCGDNNNGPDESFGK
jgi:hypothetical protein